MRRRAPLVALVLAGVLAVCTQAAAISEQLRAETEDEAGKLMRDTDQEEEIRRLKKELAIAQEERDILKKHGHLLKNTEMIYRLIREHTGIFRLIERGQN